MYSNDYAAWIIYQSKYKDFRAEAIQSELAHEARRGQKSRLVRVWHGLRAWATTFKRSRPLENPSEWNMPAETSLRK